MSPYQYKGALTVDVEESHERRIQLLEEAEQRAWDAAEAAREEAARVARENAKLRAQLSDQWRRKRNAQARARRLRDALAARPKPEPKPELPTTFGGREGLEAACREVAAYERRKRHELAA
jgi:hypothetical protein